MRRHHPKRRDPALVIDKHTRRLTEREIAEFRASVAESYAAKVKQQEAAAAGKTVRSRQACGGEFESYARQVAREEVITILSHVLEGLRKDLPPA